MRRIAGFKVDRNRLEDEKVEIEKEMEQVLAMARARLAQEKTKAASTKPTLSDRSTDGALAAVTDPGLFGSYTEETKAAPITADPIKLEETKLEETKLEETKLEETKLEETKLEETKLEEVKLEEIKIKVEEY
ncbi:hypothetical protein F4808DRAFT_321732 [Astrocystis sublimbata]|nr:hypothetical protein F4808DRAFT_321732 [Astrocystis sublimbata]